MQLNPAEISELLKSKIQNLEVSADSRNQGTVISVTDGICRIHGLSNVMQGEMISRHPCYRLYLYPYKRGIEHLRQSILQ